MDAEFGLEITKFKFGSTVKMGDPSPKPGVTATDAETDWYPPSTPPLFPFKKPILAAVPAVSE